MMWRAKKEKDVRERQLCNISVSKSLMETKEGVKENVREKKKSSRRAKEKKKNDEQKPVNKKQQQKNEKGKIITNKINNASLAFFL